MLKHNVNILMYDPGCTQITIRGVTDLYIDLMISDSIASIHITAIVKIRLYFEIPQAHLWHRFRPCAAPFKQSFLFMQQKSRIKLSNLNSVVIFVSQYKCNRSVSYRSQAPVSKQTEIVTDVVIPANTSI